MALKHPASQCKFPQIVKRMGPLTCEALKEDFRGLENTVCSKQKSVNKPTNWHNPVLMVYAAGLFLSYFRSVFLWATLRWKCDCADRSSMRIHNSINKQHKCTRASKCRVWKKNTSDVSKELTAVIWCAPLSILLPGRIWSSPTYPLASESTDPLLAEENGIL